MNGRSRRFGSVRLAISAAVCVVWARECACVILRRAYRGRASVRAVWFRSLRTRLPAPAENAPHSSFSTLADTRTSSQTRSK